MPPNSGRILDPPLGGNDNHYNFVSPALDVIAKVQEDEKKKAAIEEMQEALGLLEDAFVKCSKKKGFFGGDSIGGT
ncbi:hypothetical protein LguiA_000321 [Lonicera macranthoides]